MTQLDIAWIGAGKMGLPICQRLKAAGHAVRVLARRPEQAATLAEKGFATSGAIPDLIRNAGVVFTCVPDDKVLAEVMLNDAFTAALKPGAVVIDMSTVSPAISAKVASHLTPHVPFLRSPVSGSTVMAEAGTLTALVSGPKDTFEALAPVYSAFTKLAFHLGGAEEARVLKLAINSMVAATSVLLGEALALGRKGGLSHEAMLEVITQSAVASPLIGYKKALILSGDYRPAATVDMLKKDIELFLDAGNHLGVPQPMGALVNEHYAAASAGGLGERDFFVLIREAERKAGLA